MQQQYFDLAVVLPRKYLKNLSGWLLMGFKDAQTKQISEADFLNQRLAPDMYPLLRQIQIVTDSAKGGAARLSGVEPLKLEDNETTVEELLARIEKVLTHLETFKVEQFKDAAAQKVVLPYMPNEYQLGSDYVLGSLVPNFLFHTTIVYAILRAQGVPLGKADFIGGLVTHPLA